MMRQALWQLAVGLPIGVAGAFAVGRLLQSVLAQTNGRRPCDGGRHRAADGGGVDGGVFLAGAAGDQARPGSRAAERVTLRPWRPRALSRSSCCW